MANYIDVLFRGYGEQFFGKSVMDQITDKEVETARILTMTYASDLAKMGIKMEKGEIRQFFCASIQDQITLKEV